MKGVVVKFDEERGFGFIRSRRTQEDVFVHIKDVKGQMPLREGQYVTFGIHMTERGLSARQVRPGKQQLTPQEQYGIVAMLGIALLFVLMFQQDWHPVLSYLLAINAITFLFYGSDKAIAGTSFTRVPESILHGLAVFGGSPAALLRQRLFRHKTAKKSFQLMYWFIVALQIALLIVLQARGLIEI